MELIAHGDALGHHRGQVDAAFHLFQRRAEDRHQHIAHPAQALLHVFTVGAETHHLANPFIQVAIGAVAFGDVLHHQHRHIRRGYPAHRANGVNVVAGNKGNLAAFQHRVGGFFILRPAFE